MPGPLCQEQCPFLLRMRHPLFLLGTCWGFCKFNSFLFLFLFLKYNFIFLNLFIRSLQSNLTIQAYFCFCIANYISCAIANADELSDSFSTEIYTTTCTTNAGILYSVTAQRQLQD